MSRDRAIGRGPIRDFEWGFRGLIRVLLPGSPTVSRLPIYVAPRHVLYLRWVADLVSR
jgi:hypothetical protein